MRGRPPHAPGVPSTIGLRVRELRVRAGWSMRELAAAAGLTPPVVSRIESGTPYDPSLSTLLGFARAFGISLAELVGGLDQQPRAEAKPPRPRGRPRKG